MPRLEIIPNQLPLEGEIEIPGSKSYTNRALLLASLTDGKIRIKNPLFSEDTEAMLSCLEALMINIEKVENEIFVVGSIKDIKDDTYYLNAKLSGTTIRFILALSCVIPGVKIIKGDEGLNKRPISELVEALRQLGAEIDYLENEGFPPLKVTSSKLSPGVISLSGEISSQYVSALLMIAPLIGNLEINIEQEQVSKPYINMTLDTMEKFGVKVINENFQKYIVSDNKKYIQNEYLVEGDYSSAGYFFAIATLTHSKITLKNLNPHSKQADLEFLKILEKMGNTLNYGENKITIEGKTLVPLKVDMISCPDQIQTLAVLASFAQGKTIIEGIKSLRIKETNRVEALEKELSKMGIKTEISENQIVIYGGNPSPLEVDTYGDHRMAMSFAVAGTKLEGIKINDPEVVSKTFPTFWKKLEELGVKIIYE
jgi:3-phosphoshikimate 1-carboxyvinyltransferase